MENIKKSIIHGTLCVYGSFVNASGSSVMMNVRHSCVKNISTLINAVVVVFETNTQQKC